MAKSVVDVAWGQIQGTRDYQEDFGAIVSWPNGYHLLILADGMGGEVGGERASHTVVDSFRDHFLQDGEQDLRNRLINALSAANMKLYQVVQEEPELQNMGCTLVALVFDGSSVQWISVGDSPLWLYRQGFLQRLNKNHSVAGLLAEKVARGDITPEVAAASDKRSQLLEAVMGNDIEHVDIPADPLEVQIGDVFLVASDGVETCSVEELEELVASSTTEANSLVNKILNLVEDHGRKSQDNSTIMALKISADNEEVSAVILAQVSAANDNEIVKEKSKVIDEDNTMANSDETIS